MLAGFILAGALGGGGPAVDGRQSVMIFGAEADLSCRHKDIFMLA